MSSHASLDVDQLLIRLTELTPMLRGYASESDRLTRLPDAVVQQIHTLRLARLWIPLRYHGFELSLVETLRIYEAAAKIDGSFGWAVMIGAGGGLFAAFLEPTAANDIFAPSNAVIAGSGAPDGHAVQMADGYRVSGRWRYASGAHYATTFTANCRITRDGQPVIDADGEPLIRAMAFTPSQVTIHPAWDTSGMRGTGSHDFEVCDVFVPQYRTFSVFTDRPREQGPLYQLPFDVLTELPIAALALGIARHALDVFATFVGSKKNHDSNQPLSQHPLVQIKYAECNARWRLMQAGIYSLASRAWQSALAHRLLTARELAEITASCALCLSDLQRLVSDLAALAGMSSITRDNEFARASRDLQTLAAHISVSQLQLLSAGRTMLSSALD
jgi:alkylation response protein AidB-like acyl-CoA dehydrogenase